MSDLTASEPSVSAVIVTPAVAAVATPVTADTTATDVAATTVVDTATADASTTDPVAVTADATDVTATTDTSTDAAATAGDTATVNTNDLKDALTVAGADVSGYWDAAVAFGRKIDDDVFAGIKKALAFLESEAVDIFDEALELAKLKK